MTQADSVKNRVQNRLIPEEPIKAVKRKSALKGLKRSGLEPFLWNDRGGKESA